MNSGVVGGQSARRGRTVILMYHRVTEVESDPWSLVVHPDRFLEHLEVLQSAYDVIPLSPGVGATGFDARSSSAHFRRRLRRQSRCCEATGRNEACPRPTSWSPDRSVADREFWWDEVERIFLGFGTCFRRSPTSILPTAKLELRLADASSPSIRAESDERWRADREPTTPRQRAYLAVVSRAAAARSPGAGSRPRSAGRVGRIDHGRLDKACGLFRDRAAHAGVPRRSRDWWSHGDASRPQQPSGRAAARGGVGRPKPSSRRSQVDRSSRSPIPHGAPSDYTAETARDRSRRRLPACLRRGRGCTERPRRSVSAPADYGRGLGRIGV